MIRCGMPVGRIAFAEAGVLVRKAAVVVERRLPQHAAVRHHAGLDRADLADVATVAAGFVDHAQIAGIDEADVLLALPSANPRRRAPDSRTHRHMLGNCAAADAPACLACSYARDVGLAPAGRMHVAVAAVAIDAAELHGAGGVHAGRFGQAVTGDAAGALASASSWRLSLATAPIAERSIVRQQRIELRRATARESTARL